MRIKIVTVWKTENCGSFLQAWALRAKLVELGEEAFFADYRLDREQKKKKLFDILKSFIKLKFIFAFNLIKRFMMFNRLRKKYAIYKGKRADIYIFGSDTIWNFNHSFFLNKWKFFVGADVCKPKYSYAASVDATDANKIYQHTGICNGIKNFTKVSVRDVQTEKVINELNCHIPVTRVLDPTMLYSKNKYIEYFYNNKNNHNERVFLIYYFGNIPKDIWKEIIKFTKQRGLKIVRLGIPNGKNAEYILSEPQSFIQYYADAEYVFTNTFHGCVFSIIFEKNFVTDERNKKKVVDLISHFNVGCKKIESAEELEEAYDRQIDYSRVNSILMEDRVRSIEFLKEIIEENRNGESR